MQIFWIKFKFIYAKKIWTLAKFTIAILIACMMTSQNNILKKIPEKVVTESYINNVVELQLNNRYMTVNGVQKEINGNDDISPITVNGKMFVPIKSVMESLGTKMFWIAEKKKIIILKENCTVEMWIDKNDVYINGGAKKVEDAPFMKDDEIYAPLKFVAETLDYRIDLSENDKKIVLTNYKDEKGKNEIVFWHYDYNSMDDIVSEYKKENHDVKILKNYIPLEDYTYIINLLPGLAERDCPDVFCVNAYEVKNFVNNENIFESLDDHKYGIENLSDDMFKYSLEMGTGKDGKIRALTGFVNPCMIAYKKDLAKELLGTDEAGKISKMLSTPEKMIETAKLIKELSGGKVKFVPGNDEFFNIFVAEREKGWISGSDITIDSSLDKYVDFSKMLKTGGMESGIKPWTKEWKESIKDNKHVFYSMPIWGIYSTLEKDQSLNFTRNWGLLKPSKSYFEGGSWMGIYAKSKKKESAWNFTKFAVSNGAYLEGNAVLRGKYPNSLKISDKLAEVKYLRNSGINDNLYKLFYETALDIDSSLSTEYDEFLNSEFEKKLDEYLKGDINKEQMYEKVKSIDLK